MTPTDISPVVDLAPVVEFDGVALAFGAQQALAGLSLAVPAGAVTVLLGANGAGKTTALRVVTGALVADAGHVRVFGRDPSSSPAAGEEVRRRCGVVSAKPALYDRLSGRDNLVYAAELWGLGRTTPAIDAAAERFGISHALGLRVGGYSTGMKTRLALARAILHDPDLLLLDEPTSGLDPESSQAVLHLIDELAASGRTVVMCTHLLLEAEGLADHVVVLDAGRDVVAGAPEELVRRYWPIPSVLIDAEDRAGLADLLATLPGVVGVSAEPPGSPRAGAMRATLDDGGRVADLVTAAAAAGLGVTRVVPHEPSLEELYLRVRQGERPPAPSSRDALVGP